MRLFRTKYDAETRRRGATPKSSRLRVSASPRPSFFPRFALICLLAVAALAQTASEKPSAAVLRVGSRLACKCGCKETLASCSMLDCESSKAGKLRIAQMLKLGYSDDQIIQAFVREYGASIYLAEPDAWGWLVPYICLAFGLVIVWLFIRKYRKPRLIPEVGAIELDDPALQKYKEQIEKDLASLE
ncbi:MAG TPA: cytochrome c-type biogenesis protein CcmH [Bryobacteraceae bacterium]|nr:cytochrome c-type biogenesis protein CcmH [Bryobacteraceae bacterium]